MSETLVIMVHRMQVEKAPRPSLLGPRTIVHDDLVLSTLTSVESSVNTVMDDSQEDPKAVSSRCGAPQRAPWFGFSQARM